MQEKHIKQLVVAYYAHVRRELTNLTHTKLYVEGLGEFFIAHWKLDKETQKSENWEYWHNEKIREGHKWRYERLLAIREELDQLQIKKKLKRIERDNYLNEKQGITNNKTQNPVETPEGDTGGLEQLPVRQQENQTDGQQETTDMPE